MANVDGDITLSVNLEASDIRTAADSIKKEIEGIFEQTSGDKLSDVFERAKVSASRLYDSINAVSQKMASMEANTEAYNNVSDAVRRAENRLKRYESQKRKADAVPIMERDIDKYAKLIGKIDKTTAELDALKKKKEELASTPMASVDGEATAEYTALATKLNQLTNSATLTRDKLYELQGSINSSNTALATSRWDKFKTTLIKVTAVIGKSVTLYVRFLKVLGSTILNGVISAFKNLGSAMSGLNRHTRSSNGLLEIGFKKLVQYGFGIRTVFLLVKKLRQALIDGFGSMAQYSGEFNNIVSQFVSALNTLKLSFATAFAPIAAVALPLLTALANALISVMNIIGKFFAAITGKSTFIQAKRQQVDYAASLDKTGKSGSGAAKGIKKAEKAAKDAQKTIAGFDDVEILHDKSKDDAGAGGGGGGGGGGVGGLGDLNGADMFETVGIESKIKDFANKIRDLIGAQDWTGLGTFLGQCINSIFEKARDLISWDNIGEKITFFVTAITQTFNALVDAIDWDLIGNTFGEGVNTLINTLDLLITGIDWGNLGKSLMDGLNSFINTVNWKKLGKLFADGVNAVFNFLYNAIKTFKWGQAASKLMESVSSFLQNVDWKKIGSTVSELFKGVLEFLRTALDNFDWNGLKTAVFNFLAGIDWLGIFTDLCGVIATAVGNIQGLLLSIIGGIFTTIAYYITNNADVLIDAGGSIIGGLLLGITEAISAIGTWIVDNIFTPFINGFKSAFGIASPSTVMEEQGGFIVEGLLLGITNAWHSILEFFSGGVTGIIELIKKSNWKDSAETAVEKIRSNASKKWSTVTKFFSEGTKTVISNFKKSDWKGSGETAVDKTKSGISNNWSKISRQFSSGTEEVISKFKNSDWKGTGEESINKTKSGVDNKWSTLMKVFTTGVTNISNHIKTYDWNSAGSQIVSKLHTGVHNRWSASIHQYFVSKITAIGEYIKKFNWSGVGSNIVSKLKSGISNNWTITSYFSDRIGDIKSKFENTSWWRIGENICSGIRNGISNGWSWVTNKARDLAQAAYDAAKNKLEIKSPSRVFRDGIGKMIPAGMAAGIEDNADTAINAVKKLSNSLSNTDLPGLEIPSIAVGKVIPYDSGKTTNRVDTTLADVANLLKYNQEHALTREDLEAAMQAILPNLLRDYISFYIGDEQIARHANAGNVMLDRRFSTTG